jgi:hypothetical protein
MCTIWEREIYTVEFTRPACEGDVLHYSCLLLHLNGDGYTPTNNNKQQQDYTLKSYIRVQQIGKDSQGEL